MSQTSSPEEDGIEWSAISKNLTALQLQSDGAKQYFESYPEFAISVGRHDDAPVKELLDAVEETGVNVKGQHNIRVDEINSDLAPDATLLDSIVRESIVGKQAKVSRFSLVEGSNIGDSCVVSASAVGEGCVIGEDSQIKGQSVVSGSELGKNVQVVSSEVDTSELAEGSRVDNARISGTKMGGGVKVCDSLTEGSLLRDGVAVREGSWIENSTLQARVKVDGSVVGGRSVIGNDTQIRGQSWVYESTVGPHCQLYGAQIRGRARLGEAVEVSASVVEGVFLQRSQLFLGSAVIGGPEHNLADMLLTRGSLVANTKAKRIIACCGAVITDCDLQSAYVFGSALDRMKDQERVLQIGDACPMFAGSEEVDWTQVPDELIEAKWALHHTGHSKRIGEYLQFEDMYDFFKLARTELPIIQPPVIEFSNSCVDLSKWQE